MTTVAPKPAVEASRPATRPTTIVEQSWIMVKRNLIHTKRMPEMLSDVTVQPIMFVLLFAFVFGASIANTGGASYREFLLPGIMAQTIVFTAFVVAAGITGPTSRRASSTDSGRCPSAARRCSSAAAWPASSTPRSASSS